jgi:hypothetical protein
MLCLTLLPIVAVLTVIIGATLRVKSGRRYRGRHVRRGLGRHGSPCRSDLADRALSALARVDVWILIMSVLIAITAVAGVVIAYLTLVKPG